MVESGSFKSILAPFIIGLLEEKRSLGYNYHTEELILTRLDSYCYDGGLASLSDVSSFLDPWCMQTEKEGLANQNKRITVARQLLLYMMSMGIIVHLPKTTGHVETVLPHIFTDAELFAFFHEADTYHPSPGRKSDHRMATEYRVLFRLLYCCGLRNSEGCGIRTELIDLDKGILTILDSKGNKDRLVYIADDVRLLCIEYYQYLCKEVSGIPEWFFPGKDPAKPMRNTSVDRAFNRFWSRTSFASGCNNKPTVHDLRFTFVTNRINLWVMQGVSLDVMMPYLQSYLGHKSLQDSYYYYHNSRQLYESIRVLDKTSSLVIPEVPDYE